MDRSAWRYYILLAQEPQSAIIVTGLMIHGDVDRVHFHNRGIDFNWKMVRCQGLNLKIDIDWR